MVAPLLAFALGMALGLSLAVPPGPILALMAGEAARGRLRPALATGFGATSGDAVWATAAFFGFVAYLRSRPLFVGALGLVGAALLVYMAISTVRAARNGVSEATGGSFAKGLATVLTSPLNLAWWVSTGPYLLGTLGMLAIAGMFCAIVAFLFVFVFGIAALGRRFEHTVEILAFAGAVILIIFALLVAESSLAELARAGVARALPF